MSSGIKLMNKRNTLPKRLKLQKRTKQVLELKNSINVMRNALESTEIQQIRGKRELVSSKIEIQEQPGGRRERTKKRKNERVLGELSDYIRKSKLRITGIPAGEEKKKGTESLFKEIIDENFPSLWK